MTTLQSPRRTVTDRVHVLPLVAGVSAIAMAIYHVATPGPPEAGYESPLDWVREGLFLAFLVATVLAVWSSVHSALAPRATALLITVAYGAIAVGVLVGLVLQDDPSWFMFLGGPGILLSAAGFVIWAVWGARRQVVPVWAAVLCGIGGLLVIVSSEFGTSVLLGGFWLYLAFRDR